MQSQKLIRRVALQYYVNARRLVEQGLLSKVSPAKLAHNAMLREYWVTGLHQDHRSQAFAEALKDCF